MEDRIVHILWTGGLESTYRVVELSKTDCVIQPHYIIFEGIRKSQKYELKAIKKITEILKKDQRTMVSHPLYSDLLMIDPEKRQEEWASYTLFKDFLFPRSLFHKEKKDEASELSNDGYAEVAKKVWTCYNPIFGMPCGHCGPCRSAKLEGTGYMIPFMGNFLGAVRKGATKYPRKAIRKILPNRLYMILRRLVRKI